MQLRRQQRRRSRRHLEVMASEAMSCTQVTTQCSLSGAGARRWLAMMESTSSGRPERASVLAG
jgi:hypothetical protein